MTNYTLIASLTEALLAALSLPADEATYALAYSAVLNADEVEVPDPRLQAIFIVEAVEEALGLGLDETGYAAALAAVIARLPTPAELAARWQRVPVSPKMPPDAHLEMAYEDRANGGLDVD